MLPLVEVQGRVLAACAPRPAVVVPVADAAGLVLASVVRAAEQVPPFANSGMDGFAVRAADVAGASPASPVRLRIVATTSAGAPPAGAVGPGEAVRIMTGAPVPPGADAVAMVEVTRTEGDDVLVTAAAPSGAHIRPAGEDVAAGQEVFAPGTALGPGHLGVLASIGAATVAVHARPRVGVLSTGDELVEAGVALGPGQIRDANRRTLLALLARDGFEAVDLGIARDDEGDIRARLGEGARRCDAVLSSGGVSMGDFDYVKKVLSELAAMAWMQVAIRPAKPFAFGTLDGVPIFGLPGNPVSSMVSYELLARPGLRRMAGRADDDLHRPEVAARAEDGSLLRRADERTNYIRVRAGVDGDGRYRVRSAGGQASNLLWPMAVADALAVVPPGPGVAQGEEARVLLLG